MNRNRNPWKGAVCGLLGGVAGLLAMRLYWQRAAPALEKRAGTQQQASEEQAPDRDSISLIGQQHRQDESATAALGRLAYHALSGEDPQPQTKTALSYLVHWGYGLGQAALYGALRGETRFPDLAGGLAYGAGLWLFGDELAVPLLGLQDGPDATPPVGHLNRLGAHLSYGAATAFTAQALYRVL